MSTNEELNKELKEYTNTFVITFVVRSCYYGYNLVNDS